MRAAPERELSTFCVNRSKLIVPVAGRGRLHRQHDTRGAVSCNRDLPASWYPLITSVREFLYRIVSFQNYIAAVAWQTAFIADMKTTAGGLMPDLCERLRRIA
jgi:hypothetical protein